MNILQQIFLIFLTSLLYSYGQEVLATTYYLSENGSDANSGKYKAAPWRTLEKLGQQMTLLKSGDSILLENGSIFYGRIDITTSGIYVGSYGSGSNPIVSGSIAINKWKYFRKNIWVADCEGCVAEPGNLFIDGSPQPLGRHPNNRVLTISGASQSQLYLPDTTLNFTDDYWNKAEVVVRSSRWTFDNLTVNQYINKTFHFNDPASYLLQNGFGYFIQKHISTLDQQGEWYFDPSTKMLYVYLNPRTKPGQYLIEAGIRAVGLTADGIHNVTIENLTFTDNRIVGLRILNSSNIHLNGINIVNSGKNGMEIHSCKNIRVYNSCISGSNNNGIQWHNNTNSLFIKNQICHTGLQPGRGQSGNGNYIALYITADIPQPGNNVFQNNTIDSTGYSAIDFRTGNTVIKDNLISNFCIVKDDGGGIYTWNNTLKGNVIEGNLIFNGIGSGAGTLSPLHQYAHGIYIDDRSSHVQLERNTIFNCSGSGIFLHNAKSISVLNNLAYSNGRNISNPEKAELYIRLDTLGEFGTKRELQLKIIGNNWIVDNDATHCMYISVEKESDLRHLGVLKNNRFVAHEVRQAVAELVRPEGWCTANQLSLAEWQQATQYEGGSIFKLKVNQKRFELVGNEMIANGNMARNINGWLAWPEEITISQEKIEILDGPSLKVNIPPGKTEALLYHEGFSLDKGNLYRLSFSAISAGPGLVEFVPLMAGNPWQALAGYTCFSIGTTRNTFTYFFVVEKSSAKARVNFKSRSNFWIDNVSLHEVKMN